MKRPLKEILSEMSTNEKIKYIWEYYKYYIIGFIVLVIFVVYTVYSVANKKEDILNIVMITDYANPEQVEEVKENIYQNLLTEEEKESSNIIIQTLRLKSEDMQAGVEMQKLAAQLSAGDIDFFIADQEYFDQMNQDGQLLPFNELEGTSELNLPEDQLVSGNDNGVTGIKINSNSIFDGLIQKDEEKILFTPINVQNKEIIARFVEYYIDNEQ
ncbi:hypothetical protein [Lederbergia galactosidilytica]|uniref:Uncharacterized protein n=1 Tax=Lederbergia galactosidilytica TaxID=217031 RepID=A0A0Q9XRL1_9BACI|nr:hypothetical protein [Lederbergia galactosidilytica]KRG10892.1 hypothetical protein ACA29_19820 [Lederbergia galactosidilytica]KRG15993.1 hypothetical protein ACA30_03740 [Virgibacillus soli]MBP1915620.1 hypothetical protein [Lederbergia galactosidilytica]OAK67695.1 hypothetical protein ABB05_18455 [Lederbergia galactosidilytica]